VTATARPTAAAPVIASRTPPEPDPEGRLPPRDVASLDVPVVVETQPATPAPVVVVEDAAPAPAVGHLQIGVVPWANVSLDGVRVGTTPLAPVALFAGTYTARLEHPDFKPLVRKVTIRPGQTTPLRFDLRQDAIRNR
jgi:serine/threonine-protein kinase